MLTFRRIYPSKNNKKGFNLVELLIAVSIFSVVSIAIYSTFSSGVSILRRVKKIDFASQKMLLKAEKFARELRAQSAYKKQLFQGNKTRISFPGDKDKFPSRITYYLDGSFFMRCEDKLDTIITEGNLDPELKAKPEIFMLKVKEVNFSYLYLNLIKNEYGWTDEWSEKFLPIAVKVLINTENQNYVSTIFLPTA